MKLLTFIGAGAFIICSAFIMKKKDIIQTSPLYDTKWSLKKIHQDTGIVNVNSNAFIKFNREKKSAGGNGSCNSFGSSFSITNDKISFTNIFSTKMYCEEVQQTEDDFFRLLEKVNKFEVKVKTLIFYQGKDAILEFYAD
jgi:heat shock protein HslJ